jgi:hypothetical protein
MMKHGSAEQTDELVRDEASQADKHISHEVQAVFMQQMNVSIEPRQLL